MSVDELVVALSEVPRADQKILRYLLFGVSGRSEVPEKQKVLFSHYYIYCNIARPHCGPMYANNIQH